MYYVKGTETAHFSPKTEIGPHGTVRAPRSQLLALGTSPGWVLLLIQPNIHCPQKVGFQISGHLTISTLNGLYEFLAFRAERISFLS